MAAMLAEGVKFRTRQRGYERLETRATSGEGSVRFVGISHVYRSGRGEIPALDDVSFDAREGEVTVVVGPSGCGKSTLLELAAGLLRPTQGMIFHGERLVAGPQRDVGMAFQQPGLFPWLTVRANVALGLVARGMSRKVARDAVSELLEVVGLGGFEEAYPHELSGGMAQRVGIARAFALRPRFLLLDEPFASVDAYTRLLLQRELLQLIKRERSTVLFVTHDINEAVFLGDCVVVLGRRPGRTLAVIPVVPSERDRRSAGYLEKTSQIMKLLGVETVGSE